jgi:uncharacterized damage-inducible protein DinB
MTAKDVLKNALKANHEILSMYLSDLSDADLLVRPAPGANHIAWQLGHLISSETRMLGAIPGVKIPALPAGFAGQHNKAAAANDKTDGFRTKKEYLSLFNQVREATLSALANVPEADLARPTQGDVARLAPTLGSLFFLAANHEMMHTGQFSVTRRKLGKPVLF